MKQLLDTTAKALIFLETEQRIDGSYISYTSSLKNDFKKKQELPATFINSLILQCLHKVSGSSAIKQKLTGYVLDQKSDSWTWNYLVPVGQKKYPDDLDDTVCALGALNQYNSDIIDGTVLGCFVQNLIMAERKPGGPYNTWLIDTLKWPIWKDVDLVVNANIGWFLSMQQVHLDGLMQYIDSTIETSQFCSSYYPDRVSVLYFLSRWYNGPKKNMLYRQAQDLSKEYARNNPLQLALLLSCCVHLEFPDRLLIRLAKRLKKMQHEDGCWDAIGFFVDPTQDNATYYGGSAALTTAFAIEALVSYESRAHPLIKSTFKDTGQTQYMLTKQDCELIGSKTLRQSYQDYIRAIIRHDNGQQVTKIATITAAACRQELSSKVSNHLNLGSLNGWLAYDIFDDILDQEDHPDQLSIANYASRAMLRHFQQAFPDKPEFSSYVESVLTTMDCANDWEVRQTRLQSGSDALPIHNLPDYGTALDSLWQRSWGHSLAPAGVLLAFGYNLQTKQQLDLQNFFRHFLIARQLNDDAHDWEPDLRAQHCSAVVSLLLRSYSSGVGYIRVDNEWDNLRLHFWQDTINEVDSLIHAHTSLARKALSSCNAVRNPTIFESWINALDTASTRALREKRQVEKFITSYTSR